MKKTNLQTQRPLPVKETKVFFMTAGWGLFILGDTMGRKLELAGQKFGRLTVIKLIGTNNHDKTVWLCQCDCGNKTEVIGGTLKSGHTQSCGCLHGDILTTHGMGESPIYHVWADMKQRCENAHVISYQYYGERGVTVCKRWDKFENFFEDMGKRPEGLTIERIDNDGDYTPTNCKWATRQEQIRNSRQTKLDLLKVQVIKKLLTESQLTQGDIGEIFSVDRSTISRISTRETWKDVVYDSPICQ